jgi:MFS superfamily sulfate permease-like transporter
VENVLVIIFSADIYFANAGVFRREVHEFLATSPDTRHLVIDAAAIANIDYTGLAMLSQVVADLAKDTVTVSMARANDDVRRSLAASSDPALRAIEFYDSVDAAATALA